MARTLSPTNALVRVDEATSEERAMVLAAREGDERALAAIYAEHAPVLARRLRLFVGDAELADELLQDAFVVAFGDLSRFGGRARVGTWLHGIAFNLARQSLRKRTRRRRLMSTHADAVPRATPDGTPEELIALDQAAKRLQRAVEALPPKLREAFITRVIERLPLRDAAELLGVRVSTLSHRARRAESIVRQAFEDDTGPDRGQHDQDKDPER